MSDPLDHLLSVDLGESFPLYDVFEDENKTKIVSGSKKPFKKVRFADTCYQHEEDDFEKCVSVNKPQKTTCTKEVKGILKVIKRSKFGGQGAVKGWSKPSPSVPLTVSIICGSEYYTKFDILDENFTSRKSGESIQVLDTMDKRGENKDINSDELDGHGLDFNSPDYDEMNMFKDENIELQSNDHGISPDNAEVLGEDVSCGMNTPYEKSSEHELDQDKYLLEDEIRKISKELFVKSASHIEDAKNDDGSVKSEILLDRSFISTDIVNDILDAQCGREKLFSKGTVNSEENTDTCNTTDNKLVSVDATQSTVSSSLKLDSSSRVKRPLSPHTMKLKRALEGSVPEKPTAKDLRTIAFSAWCAIKADEKKTLVKKLKNAEKQIQFSVMKEKSLKEASAVKAFLCWKEQKEKTIKLKKQNEMKMSETRLSKVQEDMKKKKEDSDLVFKAWKKKKDEELREQLRKQKVKMKREAMNKGQSEEMKKLDAVAAFNAWKFQKSLELHRKEKENLMKKELEISFKEQEKAERDKEALKAYELWLEYKELYEGSYDWRNQLESKPPWSPPGRIA